MDLRASRRFFSEPRKNSPSVKRKEPKHRGFQSLRESYGIEGIAKHAARGRGRLEFGKNV